MRQTFATTQGRGPHHRPLSAIAYAADCRYIRLVRAMIKHMKITEQSETALESTVAQMALSNSERPQSGGTFF
jgi:hypothetical protein